MTCTEALAMVSLRSLPLRLLAEAREQADGLLREFRLISAGADSGSVPRKVVEFADRLTQRYASYIDQTRRVLESTASGGDDRVDVTYRVPPSAADAARELRDLFDEADDYCRSGDLLTLATPRHLVDFRHWYLNEFVRQINGEPPQPWNDDAHLPPRST